MRITVKKNKRAARVIIQKDSYYDSVFLMLINKQVKEVKGVRDAVVSMGTEMNITLLKETGLAGAEVDSAAPNDLIIAVEGDSEDAVDKAIDAAKQLLEKKSSAGEEGEDYKPASIDAAVRVLPEANFAVISLPGEFAPREVRKCLNRGLHVMLFSDNVSLEDEVALKNIAREKGLLMMGPDCGTAIINGKPLCFANVVKAGDIGVVGASGTGLQEITCLIDTFGGGITQAIGTGGRDLKRLEVGGTMMLMGIEALKHDAATKVIVVVSKPPAQEAADRVIAALRDSGKPSVIHFIGLAPGEDSAEGSGDSSWDKKSNLHFASNLEEAAGIAVALSKGEIFGKRTYTIPEEKVASILDRETKVVGGKQKYIRGLFTGGTLADEALIILEREIGDIYSNNQKKEKLIPPDPHKSIKHTIVDLGDDVYTVGRPHPMIDPSTRINRIKTEAEDPEVAVMLLDVVLGYGSHEDPAGSMLPALKEAKDKAEVLGGYLSIVTSITGTEGDFQGLEAARAKLESIGCVVMPSNYQASMIALEIMRKVVK